MSTPEGRRELAAAAGIADAADLLLECFEAAGLTQERLAQLLGLTPGRVSQVLHGDGNVKVATLARFLSAMGWELQLRAQTPTHDSQMQHSPAPASSHWEGEWSDILNLRQTVTSGAGHPWIPYPRTGQGTDTWNFGLATGDE